MVAREHQPVPTQPIDDVPQLRLLGRFIHRLWWANHVAADSRTAADVGTSPRPRSYLSMRRPAKGAQVCPPETTFSPENAQHAFEDHAVSTAFMMVPNVLCSSEWRRSRTRLVSATDRRMKCDG